MPIKVLVVDDSAFMRRAVVSMLESDPGIKVIGTARDGLEGLEKTLKFRPDLITLDVEMPRMNGLEALKEIMERCPTPVLMLSSLTEDGAEETLKALELGAIDFVAKSLGNVSVNIVKVRENLVAKVKAIAQRKDLVRSFARSRRRAKISPAPRIQIKRDWSQAGRVMVVAMGISTGGPRSLQEVLPYFPEDFPASILLVQHMPKPFIPTFAARLNSISKLTVKVAEHGERIEPRTVYIGPGEVHLKARKKSPTEVVIELSDEQAPTLFKPSVDVLMHSVAKVYQNRCLGVIMTGMGHDGAQGIASIKNCGGKTIAQDEDTSVVFGMPKSAIELGVIDKVIALPEMAGEIINMV